MGYSPWSYKEWDTTEHYYPLHKKLFFFLISRKHCNSIEFILEILKQMCWFGLNWHQIYLHWVEIGSICLDQLIFKIDKEIQK